MTADFGVISTAGLMERATEELAAAPLPPDRRSPERDLRQRSELIIGIFALAEGL